MSFPVQLRRTLATTTAILALAVPLSACGFDYATDRDYTPANCTNDRSATVDVLCAVVVSAEPGSGTFVASLSNNSVEDTHALADVLGEGITPSEFEPVEVAPDSLVNLAEPPADIQLTGDFESGDFVELTLEFEAGERVTLNVPVVPSDSGVWEGLDSSSGGAAGGSTETEPTDTETEESEQ